MISVNAVCWAVYCSVFRRCMTCGGPVPARAGNRANCYLCEPAHKALTESLDMGTNYYINNPCPHCGATTGDSPATLHVGKSSAGWVFLFQQIPGTADNTEDWRYLIKKHGKVTNEYGVDLTPEEFWTMVEEKKKAENNRRHLDQTLQDWNHPPEHYYYVDEEDNEFGKREFS